MSSVRQLEYRFFPVLLILLFCLASCQRHNTKPSGITADPAQAELTAFKKNIEDVYVVFEKAQEPSVANGYTYGQYYGHLYDPKLNPKPLAVEWLTGFELKNRGTPAGLNALLTALNYLGYGRGLRAEKSPQYYDLLLKHYITYERAGDICYLGCRFKDTEKYITFLDELSAKTTFSSVKAKVTAAKMLFYRQSGDHDLKKECLTHLMNTYPDELYQNTPCRDLANDYQQPRHSGSELALGKKAPELCGYDVDGNTVRLSDYQGQVVVLVYFGYW
ncbi:peroxiredoxin family protein [Planctomycetota bacterium]